MCFPERFVGDPIVIDEHCAISFSTRPLHCCMVVACNTSRRRIKVRIDFTQCTRYCVFSPVAGAVAVASMVAEVTIAPHRMRNVGVVEQNNGTSPLSQAALLLQLQHVVQVFVENDRGVMIPAGKWRRGCKQVLSCSSPPTLSPTTQEDAWPKWLFHLRPHDLIAKRMDTASVPRDDGEKEAEVAIQVHEVSGGAAYAVSAVNKTKTPYRVAYHLHSVCANETGTSAAFFFVLMDGWICNEGQTLEGYVPGCGDVALGWVVRRDTTLPVVERSPLHSFTAIICDSAALQGVAHDAMKAVDRTQHRLGNERRGKRGCSISSGREKARELLQEPNFLDTTVSESLVAKMAVVLESPPPPLPSPPNCLVGSSAVATTFFIDDSQQNLHSTALPCDLSISPEAEAGVNEGAELLNDIRQNYVESDCHDKSTPGVETHYMRDLEEGSRNIRFNVGLQIDTEVERRRALLGIGCCARGKSAADTKKKSPSLPGVCREGETSDTLDNSPTSLHIKQLQRRFDVQEALERISIETAEMTQRRVCLLEWNQPMCIICEKPVSTWALFMENPVTSQRVHFSCYVEMRREKRCSNGVISSVHDSATEPCYSSKRPI